MSSRPDWESSRLVKETGWDPVSSKAKKQQQQNDCFQNKSLKKISVWSWMTFKTQKGEDSTSVKVVEEVFALGMVHTLIILILGSPNRRSSSWKLAWAMWYDSVSKDKTNKQTQNQNADPSMLLILLNLVFKWLALWKWGMFNNDSYRCYNSTHTHNTLTHPHLDQNTPY